MGRNRSRRRNARRILSNNILTSPLTTRSGKIIKPLRRKIKVTKKISSFRSNKKEESIGADDTQQMTTAIWEYHVPDKDSWSPYDQVVQSALFQVIDMQICIIIEYDYNY
jgi:hypothetical protein